MKEDVPATIAGFYYQTLLACKELSYLAKNGSADNTKVGIERGADVKIITNDEETSIEAKFYGENFKYNSSAITHTIYNFYKNSFNDDKLIFTTNVKIKNTDNIEFDLIEWKNIKDKNIDNYIKYIHWCLIKESIEKNKSEEKDRFQDYKKTHPIKDYEQNQRYINKILNDTNINIQDFINIPLKTEPEEKQFIRKFIFNFSKDADVKKVKIISELKEEIKSNIDTEDKNKELILNLLIDRFLQTTIEPTKNEDDSLTNENISIKDFKDICANAKEKDLFYLKNEEYKNFIERFEQEETYFLNKINRGKDYDLVNKIKWNYHLLRKIIFTNINNENLTEIFHKFSINNEGDIFAIVYLVQYISVLVTHNNLDINNLSIENKNSISNLFFNEKNKYSYKYSQRNEFEEFVKFFIVDTIDDLRHNFSFDNIPIIADIRQEKPCEENINFNDLTTDIADIDFTTKEQELYESLDYRCVFCLKIKNYLNDKDKFNNCPYIKQSNNERTI